jgi:predicted SAM-dependent methyltransferase
VRLHLGASREQLAAPESLPLRTGCWLHLGEPETLEMQVSSPAGYRSFHYKLGDRLPFEDSLFTFAYSEHFLEHLFLDEAWALLKECFRVLKPRACLRIAVPDADLRTYLDPEPAGFTTGDARWLHPDKHKTRWSIYSLGCVLRECGFAAQGVVYCDKFGAYHVHPPCRSDPFYAECLELELVLQTSYVRRFHVSLVVDAVKP